MVEPNGVVNEGFRVPTRAAYLRVQVPPWPVTELSINTRVPLNGTNCNSTVQDLHHLAPSRELARHSLQARENVEQERIPTFLELGEHASLEEDLRCADTEDRLVELERVNHTKTGLSAVHVSRRDDAWGEHLVPLPELNERQAIGIPETCDTDTFKHTVAPKLIEDEWDIDTSRLLECVRYNAPDEVRLSGL